MSILIKGMEMPTGCAFCKLKRRNGKKMICPLLNEEWDIRDPMSADFKLDNCPLVPVPKHGRLGDLDELYASLKKWLIQNRHSMTEATRVWIRGVLEGIAAAPTVIEAEEGA